MDMNDFVVFPVAYILCEIVLAVAFRTMAVLFYKRAGFDGRSLTKGVVERIFLFTSLVNGYHHALTFFSAIKLATRLKHDDTGDNSDRLNDYYLVGNMISVLAAFGYVGLWRHFFA